MIPIYLEVGKKRTFAGAMEWPGWCRGGRNEEQALEALVGYGKRYAQVLGGGSSWFVPPVKVSELRIDERLNGGGGTDYGAPGSIPAYDERPMDSAEVERMTNILEACWLSFDAACNDAKGRMLQKGPRGGGRTLAGIIAHVAEAEGAYLSRLGWRLEKGIMKRAVGQPGALREVSLEALGAAAKGEIATTGPRGGKRWPPRYFVRRSAWHVLDHTWEIEDRLR